MDIKGLLVNLGKLLLCGLAFGVGMVAGGMLASLLQLPPPPMPEGIDANAAGNITLLEGPLLALALAFVARGLAGSFLARTLILSLLTWIAYTVNTQLEVSIFTAFGGGFWFTVIAFLVPGVFCSAAVAYLFPPDEKSTGYAAAWKAFFSRRAAGAWAWRLAVAAVAFMPVYYAFGLLVVPFTIQYYQQGMFGLRIPGLDQILSVLFVRSLLFLLACLPVLAAWQKSRRSLFFSLGFALFVLVGLLGMLSATWMPLSVRVPHTLEILADEFVYAGLLVLLLAGREAAREPRLSQLKPSHQRG